MSNDLRDRLPAQQALVTFQQHFLPARHELEGRPQRQVAGLCR